MQGCKREKALQEKARSGKRVGRARTTVGLALALAAGCSVATPGGSGKALLAPPEGPSPGVGAQEEGVVQQEAEETRVRTSGSEASRWAPSPGCQAKADELVAGLSLEEKIGQMTQMEHGALLEHPELLAQYFVGSVLSGGDTGIGMNAADWAAWADRVRDLAAGLRVPLIYALDAVHGQAKANDAVVFPHNIGLGCTSNPELMRQVAEVVARETAGSGVDWVFGPVLAVAQDIRWGRTYESFAQDPELVASLAEAFVLGLQGEDGPGSSDLRLLACGKHFAGDGLAEFGTGQEDLGALLDRGDSSLGEAEFRQLAIDPYRRSIERGVGSVMVSFSSWKGEPNHGNRRLITDILKGELGFQGLVVSDWEGVGLVEADQREAIKRGINAGIDIAMVPQTALEFIATLRDLVVTGEVPMERIDDAVRRIVTVKCELGLFDADYNRHTDPGLTAEVGSPEHRAVAREAVRQSLVVLQNEDHLLPLNRGARVHVAGVGADSMQHQCGGWTVSWQGEQGNQIVGGATILQALQQGVTAGGGSVTYSADGSGAAGADVAVVVLAEPPYAEWFGDDADLTFLDSDVQTLRNVSAQGVPVVAVLLSGRPMVIEPLLGLASAWVAAWLPGSEGGGVADVLLGDALPSGRLSFAWPRSVEQLPWGTLQGSDPVKGAPLFPRGHGLTFDQAEK